MTEVTEEKQRLRAELLNARCQQSAEERAEADRRIFEHLQGLREYKVAQTIFCYLSIDAEVDTRDVIAKMLTDNKTVCLPRCYGEGIMRAHRINDFDELETGVMGIPAPQASAPVVVPEDLDLIVVPCLSSSADGYRLGYGGGYYDRYLPAATNATTISLCRAALLREVLPTDAHDEPVDIVISDRGVSYV